MPITPQQINTVKQLQDTAAHDNNHQIRLVAGPGTGKSFVIEERVSSLISNGINPRNIFIVSFTKASSDDLRRRIISHCTKKGITAVNQLSVSTLHALALRVLRAAGLLSTYYPTDPMVMDNWELDNIFDIEFSIDRHIPIKRCREIRTNHEAFWSTGQWGPPNYIPPNPAISIQERTIFDQFHTPRTQNYSCVLPGEIIRQCNESITTGSLNPAALIHIDHLIVDEYQDLNPCDLEFVDHLIHSGVKAFVAGDDDQSIYSFRFASPQGIQDFVNKFQSAGDFTLQDCFRCTTSIVDTANSLISAHALPNRIAKTLNSLYTNSNPVLHGYVHRWQFKSGIAESKAIAESCRDLIQAGVSPSDILILLSNSRVLQLDIVKEMDDLQVPYGIGQSSGYINFDDGRFVLACLRIICNTDDYVAHRIILGSIRGVGTKTCNNIVNTVVKANLNFRNIFYTATLPNVFKAREVSAINETKKIVSEIAQWQETDTLQLRSSDLDRLIIDVFGAEACQVWQNNIQNLPVDITLKELRDYLWTDNEDQKNNVLNAIYSRLDISPPDQAAISDKVRIMTMHGSKGLSSKIVFIPGLEDEILPGSHRRPYPGLVLEAARLLYMSITRAKIACVLSYTPRRMLHGTFTRHTASRFNSSLNGTFQYRTSGLAAQDISSIVQDIPHLE